MLKFLVKIDIDNARLVVIMKEQFLNHSLQFIMQNETSEIDKEKQEKLLYGLEGLYLTITKLILISLIALFLKFFQEFVIILLLFNILRFPAFGFHANNSKTCLVASICLIVGLPYLLLHISISYLIKIIICIGCCLCFLVYAPADTKKRPLTNKRKRLIRKICSTGLAIIYSVIILTISNNKITNLFISALLIETILILPITYFLFHESYKNYQKV